MSTPLIGSRRAILKASVAVIAVAAGGGVLAACDNSQPSEPAAVMPEANPVVATKYGKVKGYIEDGITVFKGVRYGADTATTRFQAPRAPEPWTDVKDALAYANSAPQPVSGDGGGLFKSWRPDPPIAASEDCLFLNVWTPAADGKKRPVLVWFHGGGFATGSGSSYAYDGVRLAKRGDVVVVTGEQNRRGTETAAAKSNSQQIMRQNRDVRHNQTISIRVVQATNSRWALFLGNQHIVSSLLAFRHDKGQYHGTICHSPALSPPDPACTKTHQQRALRSTNMHSSRPNSHRTKRVQSKRFCIEEEQVRSPRHIASAVSFQIPQHSQFWHQPRSSANPNLTRLQTSTQASRSLY